MADNPIKHDDLIQPGNPFDKAVKGLTDMIKLYDKLLKDIRKSAKEQIDVLNKLNVATKQGQAETKKSAKAVQKLTEQEKAALSIKRSLEREQAKLNAMSSKEYMALIKTKEATRQKNAELRKAAREMDKGTKSTNTWAKALGSFAAKFNTIGNVAANAISRIAQGLKRVIIESIQVAARAEGIRTAFAALNKPGLLKNLQDATRGTVDNVTLMQKAVQAKNFKIPLEQLALFFEFATNRAIQTGESVDYLVDSIITGIGRKSVLVMDNLGISAIELQEEIRKVGSFGEAAANIIQREMALAGIVLDTAAIEISVLNTEWKNFIETMGRAGLGILDFLGGAQFAGNFATLQKLNDEIAKKNELREFGKEFDVMQNIVSKFNFRQSGLWEMTMAISEMEENAPETFKAFVDSYEEMAFKTYDIDVALNEKRKKLEAQRENEYLGHLEILSNASDAATQKSFDGDEIVTNEKLKNAEMVFQASANFANALSNIVATQKAKELSAVGDNAKKREEIEKKYAKKEQAMAISKAIIGTALAVINALQTQPFLPMGPIMAIIAGVAGGIEIAAIAGESFAEGGSGLLDDKGGVLPGKRHSQGGVNLGAIGEGERGEYFGIVNRQMTKKYAGDLPNIFDSLNNGAFHEIWGRSNITTGDPYTKKMYELMQNTPVIIPEGKRIEKYPTGRTRIVNV